MSGPHEAAEAFSAYVFLLVSATDSETLFHAIRQADNDPRLSRNQNEALDTVASAKGKLLKLEVL